MTTVGGHARAFTDSKTAMYENLVRMAAVEAMGEAEPFDCAIEVHIRARFTPPASVSKKHRIAMIAGDMPPIKSRVDIDNICKAVMDGLNKVAFRDDVLIVQLTARKLYAARSGVDVIIRKYENRQV